jgi:hypothetical protein
MVYQASMVIFMLNIYCFIVMIVSKFSCLVRRLKNFTAGAIISVSFHISISLIVMLITYTVSDKIVAFTCIAVMFVPVTLMIAV